VKKLLLFYWVKFTRWIENQLKLYRFLKEIESYQELHRKYTELNVTLYHARCEMGADAWLKVLERVQRQPTVDSIMEVFNDDRGI
jgi:hypothetical protein